MTLSTKTKLVKFNIRKQKNTVHKPSKFPFFSQNKKKTNKALEGTLYPVQKSYSLKCEIFNYQIYMFLHYV